jgi:serine/threonine-protein phosphatase 2A activator
MITVFFPTFLEVDNFEVIISSLHLTHFSETSTTDQTEIPVSAILRLPLPPTNLYFMAVMRIHDVKHGPFYEHSSQLHSIAAGVPNWGKVNSGLFKMYEVCGS